MPNRLDIELTSIRGDGSYTWRAAGARQPKGVIDAKVLADNAKVGDVLRVEAEVEIDGITILGVLPPKEKATPPGRIELLGSSKPIPAVTTVLLSEAGRGDRRDLLDSSRRGDRSASRDRRPARGADRPDTRRPRPATGAPEGVSEVRVERRPRPEGAPTGGPPRSVEGRPGTPQGERRPERRPRPEGAPTGGAPRGAEGRARTPDGERRPRTPGATRRPGAPAGARTLTDTGQAATGRSAEAQAAPRRTVSRFEPGTAHRDLLLESLAAEQRPIAERLAAGGIPAVRRAIAAERERARSEGRPEVTGEAILALAEQLALSVKQAIWLDRAEAAVAQLDHISLRDLRATVVAAAPRDEASRELDRKLREELDRRVKKLRSNWEEQITHALEEGRVLQALRFSAQPPEPTARFPAALVGRLASSAGAAMTSSTPLERWLALLDAAVGSPIRRQIHPEGLPADPSGEVVRKARVAAGSLPALAPMLGLPMPPPPKPLPSARPSRPPRPARPARPPRSTLGTPRQAVSAGTTAGIETSTEDPAAEAPALVGDTVGTAHGDLPNAPPRACLEPEASTGEVSTGEPSAGEAGAGEPSTGEAVAGEAAAGDALAEAVTGDAVTGDALGEAGPEDHPPTGADPPE